jgi:purine-binding chemotaxis protein CheW
MLPLEEIGATEPGTGDKAWHCATTDTGTVILDGHLLLNDRQFFLEDEQIIASGETERTKIHESPTNE